MKKKLLPFFILLLLFYGCFKNDTSSNIKTDLEILNLLGQVKTVEAEVFEYFKKNDSLIIGDKINSYAADDRNETLKFNELGYLISRIEFYITGQNKYEEKYEYDEFKRLIKINKTDHYGRGSKMSNQYFYNQSDSIIKSIITENDFQIIILGERDKNNRLVKRINLVNDTTQNTFTFKYDNNGNIIDENSYLKVSIPSKLISRIFKKNLLHIENIQEYNRWDTLKYQNIYKYDTNKRISSIKLNFENENNYTLISNTYDINSNLIHWKSEPIGATRYSILINKWDKYGNLIEHSRTDSKSEIKDIWTYKYSIDKLGNWITKKVFKNNNPLSISKRIINYYN